MTAQTELFIVLRGNQASDFPALEGISLPRKERSTQFAIITRLRCVNARINDALKELDQPKGFGKRMRDVLGRRSMHQRPDIALAEAVSARVELENTNKANEFP